MNISIVIHYSKDRKFQLENTIACLGDMDGIQDTEKILLVDGETNIKPAGWKVVEIPRRSEHYEPSYIWNTGFKFASNEMVLTLESDRILPKYWLPVAIEQLKTHDFVCNKKLYQLKYLCGLEALRIIRDYPDEYYKHKKAIIEDFRVNHPDKGIAKKNPMSGCLLCTKEAFNSIGGFDERYLQAGYHDLDAFRTAYIMGKRICALNCIELHQKHDYIGGWEQFREVNMENKARYYEKWKL